MKFAYLFVLLAMCTKAFAGYIWGYSCSVGANPVEGGIIPVVVYRSSVYDSGAFGNYADINYASTWQFSIIYDNSSATTIHSSDLSGGTAITLATTGQPAMKYSVTIPAGQLSATVNVQTVNNSTVEWDRSSSVVIGYGTVVTYTPVTIYDDDSTITLSMTAGGASGTVTEGSATSLRFSRDYLVSARTINYAVTGGTASPSDYTIHTATIPSGGGYIDVPFTANADLLVEGDETAIVQLAAGTYRISSTTNAVTVHIADDYPIASVTTTTPYAKEATLTPGTFTFSRSGNLTQPVTINFAVTGTAVAGTDYVALPSSITIPATATSATLNITPLTNSAVDPAQTVVVTLQSSPNYVLGLDTNAVVAFLDERPDPRLATGLGERYTRGTATNISCLTQVIPFGDLHGFKRPNIDPGSVYPTVYRMDATNSANQSFATNRISINTPVASFGKVWKQALYPSVNYQIGFENGVVDGGPILISVYARSNNAFITNLSITVPDASNATNWADFTTNGFTRMVQGYGLKTLLETIPDLKFGSTNLGYQMTHLATDTATNYIFLLQAKSHMGTNWTVIDSSGTGQYEPIYDLVFDPRPAFRSRFLDEPQFASQPLPSDLWGKTVEELQNYNAPVTATVSLTPSACLSLDASPELRRHPILDQFVSDMNSDPIALANYVFNEIGLTDPLGFRDDGNVAKQAISEGGVNRSAVGVYLEGRGSPIEQDALLIYLLRKAGYPAAYVFPPDGGLQLLDTRAGLLLRMRIKGGQDPAGRLYTTNHLIAVNYPWVAAYVNGQWLHLFPWLKDTQATEGFNLTDFLPDNYKSLNTFVRDYVYGKANVMAWVSPGDDTAGTIFQNYLNNYLQQNAPGVSMDDIGIRFEDRRHVYARWSDFPRPTWVTNICTGIESLGNLTITNVSPTLTNLFDTASIEIISLNNPSKRLATPEMRMSDLHNRRFYLTQTAIGGGVIQATLVLAPYSSYSTGSGTFSSSDTGFTNRQSASFNLDATDDQLSVRIRHRRQKALTLESPLTGGQYFLDFIESRIEEADRPLRKGDIAAICLASGNVTPAMLRVHAQDLWNTEHLLSTNSAAASSVSTDTYQGSLLYLAGMNYYKTAGQFEDFDLQLNKVQRLSRFDIGLVSLGARRNPDGTLYNGVVDPIWPAVDFTSYEIAAEAGNVTARLDQGGSGELATQNYSALSLADGSAQEHAILNRYFGQSNAVSTVKLLQAAQATGVGIVELRADNYLAAGEVLYGGVKLKNIDPSDWSYVVSTFQDTNNASFVEAWITAGKVTSGSFTGSGVLIFAPASDQYALIGRANGGFADSLPPSTISTTTLPNWDLHANSDDNYTVAFTQPTTSAPKTATEVTPVFETPNQVTQLTSGALQANATQVQGAIVDGITLNGVPATEAQLAVFDANLASQGKPDNRNNVWGTVLDPVNTLTGEFYIDAVDLTLPGPMPMQVRRNYGSQNTADNQLGFGWKLNYMPFLTVATTNNIIYASEPDGSVLAFGLIASNYWAPTTALNPGLNNDSVNGIGSVANRLNARLVKLLTNSVNTYYLTNADGSLRVFQEASYPISGSIARQRPYLKTWSDSRGNSYSFDYGTDATLADYGQVRRISSSNGSVLRFIYDVYGHIVEAYSLDGQRVRYTYDTHGDLVNVTLPDTSEVQYSYLFNTNVVSSVTNIFSTHQLVLETKPDGRLLKNEYDGQRRVTNQWATVGPDLRLVRNGSFIYTNNFSLTNIFGTLTGSTTVLDYTNRALTYYYTNGLVGRILDPLGLEIDQFWYLETETNAPAFPRSLKKTVDKRGLITTFFYDGQGNLTKTTRQGDLLGDGNTNTTATAVSVYNANNLPTTKIDPLGNTNLYFYTNTWMLSRVESWPNNATTAQGITNAFLYANVTNVTTGTTAFGMRIREWRAQGTADEAETDWGFDGTGYPLAVTNHAGSAYSPDVITTFVYNSRGELIQSTDASGDAVTLTYDPNGKLASKEIYAPGSSVPMQWEYRYYNDNGELTWSDGARYNPEDYVWRDYDGHGRQTQEIRWRSRAKSDGSGVEAETGDNLYATSYNNYDPFDNLTSTIDPLGNSVVMQYDALGRMTNRQAFAAAGGSALSTEIFGYEPGGEVSGYTNALGGITTKIYTTAGKLKQQSNPDGTTLNWRYDLSGRVVQEFLSNGAYWTNAYNDAARTLTRTFSGDTNLTEVTVRDRRGNVTSFTDRAGAVFSTSYDLLDRPFVKTGPSINGIQSGTVYTFDANGRLANTLNNLNESEVFTYDAAGRMLSHSFYNGDSTLARVATTSYSLDHNSITTVAGTNSSTAITNIVFTDTYGKTVLAQSFPTSGVTNFTASSYDLAGNLVYSRDEVNQTNSFAYDGLNRLQTQTYPDGKTVTLGYDAGGNLTSRAMPGGLTWSATYDNANRKLTEQLATSSATNRQFAWQYIGTGTNVGLLQKAVDIGRGASNALSYDVLMRITTNTWSGALPEHSLALSYQYDRHGLVTSLTQAYASGTNTVSRSFDVLGELLTETVSINGVTQNTFAQSWNAGLRRSSLAASGTPMSWSFQQQADGQLTQVSAWNKNYTFAYDNNGLLVSRTNPFRKQTIGRDGEGQILTMADAVGPNTALSETLAWRADGRLTNYTATRWGSGAWNDSRNFNYNTRDQLTTEGVGLATGVTATDTHTYDTAGLGVHLSSTLSSGSTNNWSTTLDGFSRAWVETVNEGTETVWASGLAIGSGSVAVSLNGIAQSGVLFDPRSSDGRWRVSLTAPVGTNKVVATGTLPISGNATSATNSFIVLAQDAITDMYDGAGNLTTRTMTGSRTQTLKWDALGRLVYVQQVDAGGNGYTFTPIYDGLGRRIRTVQTVLTNSVAVSGSTVTVDSFFDPLVEFLELGVAVNGQRTWKVYGPDLAGGYGAHQGIGGLEAISRELDGVTTGLISDAFGNTLGNMTALNLVNWTSMLVSGFGPVEGFQVPVLSPSVNLVEATLWRGKRLDPTGFYQFGVRYEDPVAARFISADPMGHAVSLSLYDYCGNDPINGLDPDGRWGKVGLAYAGGLVEGAAEGLGNELVGAGKFAKGITFDFGQQITLTGIDAYEAYSNGNGDFESAIFKSVFNQTLEGKSNGDMAKEFGLNMSGYRFGNQIYENQEHGSETGDYSQFSENMGSVASLAASPLLVPQSSEPLRIEAYDVLKEDTSSPGQAHHLNQNAVYRDVIPQGKGVSIKLEGDAFTEPGTQHYDAHASLEEFWSQFRSDGARAGELPTNLEYTQALRQSLRSIGLDESQVQQAVRAAIRQRVDYNILGGEPVPRLPGRLNQVRKR